MRRQVAAFDFDGTISRHDTFGPFMRRVAGWPRFLMAGALSLPRILFALVHDGARDGAKAAMVRRVFTGRPEADVRAVGEQHAARIVQSQLRDDTQERLQWHREQGHEIVIVSASPTVYLDAVARALGLQAVLSTRLAVGPDGRLTGAFEGRNVRRDEKVRRLDAWLDGDDAEVWAYGDSKGDDELLARADHATRV